MGACVGVIILILQLAANLGELWIVCRYQRFFFVLFGILILQWPLAASAKDNFLIAQLSAQCSDGKDNDGDGKIDFGFAQGANDPGCASFIDDDESDDLPQCSDGKDNEDSDSLADMKDPCCLGSDDNDETSECEDKIDNDKDGKIDFGKDPGCKSRS